MTTLNEAMKAISKAYEESGTVDEMQEMFLDHVSQAWGRSIAFGRSIEEARAHLHRYEIPRLLECTFGIVVQ